MHDNVKNALIKIFGHYEPADWMRTSASAVKKIIKPVLKILLVLVSLCILGVIALFVALFI